MSEKGEDNVRENLRIPGPTPLRDDVARAVGRPMINYRGPEMAELLRGIVAKLKRYLATEHDVLLLTSSGTGGLEAAVANTLSPGDRVVAVSAGVFGERFCRIAETFGADVRRLDVEWGRAADPEDLRRLIRRTPDARAVLVTHNETSTGIAHPLEEMAAVVREETEALLLVDGVSSLGAMPLPMGAWAVDLVVTGSQKAWGVPPGMAFLFASPRVWEASKHAKMPRFFFDLERYREAHARGTFPFTPALPVVYALDVALDRLLEETPEGVFRRHADVAARARAGLAGMGFPLFGDEAHASPTVTAVRVPGGIDEAALVELLRTRYRTVLARGQERLKGRIVRLGHLGWVSIEDVTSALAAVRDALADLGHAPPPPSQSPPRA